MPMPPPPVNTDLNSQPKRPGDLLTLKVVSASRETVPILVFPGLSVLDLGLMYATDRRQTDVRRASSPNAPYATDRHNIQF